MRQMSRTPVERKTGEPVQDPFLGEVQDGLEQGRGHPAAQTEHYGKAQHASGAVQISARGETSERK